MIITKEVSLKWSVTNAQHYIKKGYAFTKYNHKFTAKVVDLPVGSDLRVDIECDRCGKRDTLEYRDVYRKQSTEALCLTCSPIVKKGPLKDLTGLQFGSLRVIGLSDEVNYQGRYLWNTVCVCGTPRSATGYMLEKGIVANCGCNHKRKARPRKDLSGKTFHNIVVLGLSDQQNAEGKLLWTCRCKCRKKTKILLTTGELTRGSIKNCGCKINVPIDLKGKRFGKLKVIGVSEESKERVGVWWRCRCSCGREVDIMTGNLRAGNRTSCGCRGKRLPKVEE